MANFGAYRAQSNVAREAGTGGPSHKPGGADKRIAIVGLAVLVAGIVGYVVFV